mmetsp:Transcript_25217/g.62001  ORF Transcript_25217/g.62001 Transcript_25217/m.62001 type:complete len:219 (+) Transcript_25217:2088-2744(+)
MLQTHPLELGKAQAVGLYRVRLVVVVKVDSEIVAALAGNRGAFGGGVGRNGCGGVGRGQGKELDLLEVERELFHEGVVGCVLKVRRLLETVGPKACGEAPMQTEGELGSLAVRSAVRGGPEREGQIPLQSGPRIGPLDAVLALHATEGLVPPLFPHSCGEPSACQGLDDFDDVKFRACAARKVDREARLGVHGAQYRRGDADGEVAEAELKVGVGGAR